MSDSETIFGQIIAGKIPSDKVFEDDRCLVIRDLHPAAPTHLLVLPKRAGANLEAFTDEDEALLGHLLLVAARVAAQEGLADGYRIVLNNGRQAGQEVMHLHLHCLGGRPLTWPPG